MKALKLVLVCACTFCLSTAAFAQTTPSTSAPIGTGGTMQNGTMTVPQPLNQSGTTVNDAQSVSVDGTMGNANSTTGGMRSTKRQHMRKTKTSMPNESGKMKTKM